MLTLAEGNWCVCVGGGCKSAHLQEKGEALQGEAFASDDSAAYALSNVRALLELGELGEHDGHIVGS